MRIYPLKTLTYTGYRMTHGGYCYFPVSPIDPQFCSRITVTNISSLKAAEGVQAAFSMDEMLEVEELVKKDPMFKEALKRQYGIEDTSLVMADIWSVGYYGAEEERRLRLAKPICYLRADPTDNGYARPLEGIRPVVDVNKMKVS